MTSRPAVMFCHWPGLYNQGTQVGFKQFQKAILALERRFRDQTIWMKVSEIGRYWAAKQLTTIQRSGNRVTLKAPFATTRFTLRLTVQDAAVPKVAIA